MDKILTEYESFIVDDRIGLVYISDFLSDECCDHLVGLAYDLVIKRSELNGNIISPSRTSSSAYIPKQHDDVVAFIENVVSYLTDRNLSLIEQLQVVVYNEGEFFNAHYDAYSKDLLKSSNFKQREYTFFIYLNTVIEGGEKVFPKLNIKFNPKKGDALFWRNCNSDMSVNDLSFHQGNPPKRDMKFGLNVWIHSDSQDFE